MNLDGTVVVAEFVDVFEADVAEATLRAERIPVSIVKDSRHSMMGKGLIGPGTRGADPVIQLIVNEEDVELAKQLLAFVKTRPLGEGDPEVEAWVASIGHRQDRRSRGVRSWVLFCVYGLFAVLVIALLIAGFNTIS